LTFPPGFDQQVAGKIAQYFQGKSFKSFAALNVIYGGENLGVVNVESNMKCVFGSSFEKKREIEALLKPFCLLLGFVIKP